MQTEEFALYLARNDIRTSSIDWYVKLVERMLAECQTLTKQSVEAFLFSLKDGGKKSHYLNHYVYAIHHWGKCFGIGELLKITRFKERDRGKFERAIFSGEEVESFLSLPYPFVDKPGFYRRKERYQMWILFFTIFAWSGMRPGEIASLRCDGVDNYVDLGANVYRLKHTKTKPRNVPIYKDVRILLETYIKGLTQPYLFPVNFEGVGARKSANPYIGPNAWLSFFKQQLTRMGIKRENLDPYSFRHTWVNRNVKESTLKMVQEIVGHESIETTAIYLHTTSDELQEVVNSDPLQNLHIDGKGMLEEKEKEIVKDHEKMKEFLWVNIKDRTEDRILVEYKIKKSS